MDSLEWRSITDNWEIAKAPRKIPDYQAEKGDYLIRVNGKIVRWDQNLTDTIQRGMRLLRALPPKSNVPVANIGEIGNPQ